MPDKRHPPLPPMPAVFNRAAGPGEPSVKVQLIIPGKELILKKVAKSGKSGRVYLPLEWVGKTVKVVRVD